MPELTPESNGTPTDTGTDVERSVSERMAALGRRSGEARRRNREAKEELSVDDKAERELDRLLSSSDPKEREKGLRQYGYVRGKRQPTPAKQDPEPDPERPRGVFLSGVLDVLRASGVEFITLDDVAAYAREHGLVLRPRRDGEGGGASSEPDPVPTTPPTRKGTPTSL